MYSWHIGGAQLTPVEGKIYFPSLTISNSRLDRCFNHLHTIYMYQNKIYVFYISLTTRTCPGQVLISPIGRGGIRMH